MNAGQRTYRVPKRVVKQVDAALAGAGRRHGNTRTALDMAQTLTGGNPVPVSVPATVAQFFTRDWRFHADKVRDAGLYGGPVGLEWALKCIGPDAVTADAAVAEEGYGEAVAYSHDDVDRLLAFGRIASVPRWSPAVEDEDEVIADLVAKIDEAFAAPAGVEDLTADTSEAEAIGVTTLAVDEDDADVEEVLTVAAMRDAVAAASASLESATLQAEAAPVADAVAEAGEGNPKV